MRKDNVKFQDLVDEFGQITAVSEMIQKGFAFNMGQSILGKCTNYKERLCYDRNNVNDRYAVILSTLLSNLVDQAKQGIEFTEKDWGDLQKYLRQPKSLPEPQYKRKGWSGRGKPLHIIDHLRFTIAKPTIDRELAAFNAALKAETAQEWDVDLAVYFKAYESQAKDSRSTTALFEALKRDIAKAKLAWDTIVTREDATFPEKVGMAYETWQSSRQLPEFFIPYCSARWR